MSGSDARIPMREVLPPEHPWYGEMADSLAGHDPDLLDAQALRFDDTYRAWNPDRLLPQITAPVLLLQGDPQAGGLLPEHDVDLGMQLLSRVQRVQLTGVGHGLHWQAPRLIAEHIHEFATAATGKEQPSG